MKLTKQSTFGNTAVAGNVTYRMALSYIVVFGVGGLLFMSPLFRWNWLAMAAYVALASIVIGQTPTKRSLMTNLYGILFKKPQRSVVSDLTTTNTLGHGVKDVIQEDDLDVVAFKLMNGNYALVYTITSDINYWSTEEDYLNHAVKVKNMFNVFEGGEGFMIITKSDSDTSMLKLEQDLEEHDVILGPDYEAMSLRRRDLLHKVATLSVSRNVQQYGVLLVKPKNIKRTTSALRRATRTIRPATNPGDVILAAIGLEGGVEQDNGSD